MSLQLKSLSVVAGMMLATACVTTTHDKGGSDASTGGTSSGGSGGGGTGGTATGGGGTSTGGSVAEAGPDGADASKDGAPAKDGSDGATSTCAPADANACEACLAAKCCAVYNACSDATCGAQIGVFQTCMIAGAASTDGGVASVSGCIGAVIADGGTLAANTAALATCMSAPSGGDAGAQNCSVECFGANAVP